MLLALAAGHAAVVACEPHCSRPCHELNGDVYIECGGCADTAEWQCRPAVWSHKYDGMSPNASTWSHKPAFDRDTCSDGSSTLQGVDQTVEQTVEQRAKAAIVGAWVADAATMGLHWIYDPADIHRRLAGRMPEFFEPPSSPDYGSHTEHAAFYRSGANSPYADEVLPLLRSIAHEGRLDARLFAVASTAFLGSYGGYMNSVMRRFVAAEKSGVHWPRSAVRDRQAHALVKVPALSARYAGSPELALRVEEAIRVHQDDEVAVAVGVAAAKILERVILGASVAEALAWASGAGSEVQQGSIRTSELVAQALCGSGGRDFSAEAAADLFGRDCTLPGAFQLALHIVAGCVGYATGIRDNILAAGDQSSRAMFIGALLAAEQGYGAIPSNWKAKVESNRLAEVERLSERLVRARDV